MPDEAASAPEYPPPAPVPEYPPPETPPVQYPSPQYPPPQAPALQYPPAYQQPGFQPGYPQPGYPQPGYPQPGYQQAPFGAGYWYRPPITNGMATASLVLAIAGIFFWILVIPELLAVVFGHIALRAISQSNGQQTGQGMAIAGLIIGYLELIGFIALVIAASSSG